MIQNQQDLKTIPSLSVIVPNYNHGAFIARGLDAILRQTLSADEIIVIDDGSTDDSVRVIEEFRAKSPCVRLIRNQENQGLVRALQRGLELAGGTYIYFGAADDWVLPGFFSLAVELLEQHPKMGLFAGEALIVDGTTGRPLGIRPPVRPRYRAGPIEPAQVRKLLEHSDNWLLTGSTLFRRNLVLSVGGFDAALGSFADSYLSRKIALTYGFCFAPRTVAAWCIFPTGASRTTALDPNKAQHALDTIPPRLASDSAFPKGYADRFSKRWRFATSRLSLQSEPINSSFIISMAGLTEIDRKIIQGILAVTGGRLGRLALLGWLWFRLRPYRLVDLSRTALMRKFEHWRGGDSMPRS
jgi:glycosyltransferase involved in cell wall biosynthesis